MLLPGREKEKSSRDEKMLYNPPPLKKKSKYVKKTKTPFYRDYLSQAEDILGSKISTD